MTFLSHWPEPPNDPHIPSDAAKRWVCPDGCGKGYESQEQTSRVASSTYTIADLTAIGHDVPFTSEDWAAVTRSPSAWDVLASQAKRLSRMFYTGEGL